MSIVISLYDNTGTVLQPWADNGYRCVAVGQYKASKQRNFNKSGGHVEFINTNVNEISELEDYYDFAFAFPSNTDEIKHSLDLLEPRGSQFLIIAPAPLKYRKPDIIHNIGNRKYHIWAGGRAKIPFKELVLNSNEAKNHRSFVPTVLADDIFNSNRL